MKTPYEVTKERADKLGVDLKDLRVLAAKHDPFYVGTPANWRDAEWFADVFQRVQREFPDEYRWHHRKIHYKIVNMDPPVKLPYTMTYKLKNQPRRKTDEYKNIKNCRELMELASKYARYLGLVPFDAIIDMRSKKPLISADWGDEDEGPDYEVPYEYWYENWVDYWKKYELARLPPVAVLIRGRFE